MLEVEADYGRRGVARVVELRRHRLVQIGPECLRHPLVHGFADERVLEAEAVLLAHDVGPDQAAPDELEHPRVRQLPLVGRDQLEDRLEREAAADHRRALEHCALGRVEPVQPRMEDVADRAAKSDVAGRLRVLLIGEGGQLLEEERISLGQLRDALAHDGGRVERVEQAARVQVRQGLEPQSRLRPRDPLRPPFRELGRARQRSSTCAPPRRTERCSIRSSSVSSAQWMSSKTATSGRSRASSSNRLRVAANTS